ncbi:hypothetical protein CspHIS471_0509170 [Cutaneotrichosporon sp. HIS471]|nr:hypothetical protein CspHIS471_0509170 [Cutaneotrichosporon sp. HIS471]
MGADLQLPHSSLKAFVEHIRNLPSDEWTEGIPQVLRTFLPPFTTTPVGEDKHWTPTMRRAVRDLDKERVKVRCGKAEHATGLSSASPPVRPQALPQAQTNGSSRDTPPHLLPNGVPRANGQAPRWGPTYLQQEYESMRASQLAPPLRVGPHGRPPGIRAPPDLSNITYHSLLSFLTGPPGPVVRVHHHKRNAGLIWDGTPASGFSAPMFRALSPSAYVDAMDAAQLGGRWNLGLGVRELAAKHILGQTEEPSPWISATTHLDAAIAIIARELALGMNEVRLAVIIPTNEVRIPAADVLKPVPGQVYRSAEWLFYGRIFAGSVIADIRWTRGRLPFDLPPKFWKSRGEGSWTRHLRWDARIALWPNIRLILQRPAEVSPRSTLGQSIQSWRWPAPGPAPPKANGSSVQAPHLLPARPKHKNGRYRRGKGGPKDLLGDAITPLNCLDDSDGEIDSVLPAPLDPIQLDLLPMLRPPLLHRATSSSSGHHTPEGPALPPLLAEISVFVVPAKMDMVQAVSQIEALGGERALRPEDARVIITALRGRPRLERVLGNAVDTVPILRAEFLSDAYSRAQATGDVLPSLPKRDDYRIPLRRRSVSVEIPSTSASKRPLSSTSPITPSKRHKVKSPKTLQMSGAEPGTDSVPNMPAHKPSLEDITLYSPDIRFRTIPRLAVQRPSPLTCPNQDIIDAIKPIYLEREYDELAQLNTNVLSYRRSMAIIKSVPRRIKNGEEARKLVDVGAKVANRIDEYLTTGQIAEAEEIKASPRFQALRLFSSVWSVGHSTAAELWRAGCRDLEDVRLYFSRTDAPPLLEDGDGWEYDRATAREERARRRRREEGTMTREEVVSAWLNLKEELDTPIPRHEVVEIGDLVAEHLEALSPGCAQTITGSYRRGKETTSDVDVVFRPPKGQETAALLGALLRRLIRFGIITHVLQLSERETGTPLHHGGANFDNLDKAFVILCLPGKGRLHRRVDLICAPPSRYAAAVLSWSGSMMFERDLRRWAEDRGYKFRAGLIEIATNREVNLDSEREILRFLGLEYVPPDLRNADG